MPRTLSVPPSEPRRPFFMTSPRRSELVGSPTRHQSITSSLAPKVSTTRTVPSTAGPSSSLVSSNAIEPGWAGWVSTKRWQAVTMAATLPFISAAPRPCSIPSITSPEKGGYTQSASGPVGTTSVCPANTNNGPSVPRRSHRFLTSPNGMNSGVKPCGCNSSTTRS